jgi:hypothetical protein
LICVYEGNGPTDAHLVHHWLSRNGIDAQLRVSPPRIRFLVAPSWPTIWVAQSDEARARLAIGLFEGPTLVHPKWPCGHCGEINEANFGSCWSCEQDRG